MVNVSNNSRLTQQIHQAIENKFNLSEKASFLEWLKLIEEKQAPRKFNLGAIYK
jgi:hypothetical protein